MCSRFRRVFYSRATNFCNLKFEGLFITRWKSFMIDAYIATDTLVLVTRHTKTSSHNRWFVKGDVKNIYVVFRVMMMTTTKSIKSQSFTTHDNTDMSERTIRCIHHTKITTYRRQLYLLLLLVVLWCIYIYVQYEYYYSSATIAAVNRWIRHEALQLEQQQQQQQQKVTPGRLQKHLDASIPQQLLEQQPSKSSSQQRMAMMNPKISPQALLLRRGTGVTLVTTTIR